VLVSAQAVPQAIPSGRRQTGRLRAGLLRIALGGAAVALAAGTLTGCGRATTPAALDQAADSAPAANTAGATPSLLRFTGRTLAGAQFAGGDLAGKPTVLWFWAPWCSTCAGQAPTVDNAATKYAGKVNVVGVAGLGNTKAMREFVTDTEIGDLTQLNDSAGAIWRRFGIVQQSTYVLLDAHGKVTHRGWLDSQDFDRAVGKLAAA